MEISLTEAWCTWFSGDKRELLQSTILWGYPIWWWGRIGKVIQFIGALTIIAEILGPERIRGFGNSLRSTITLNSAIDNLRGIQKWLKIFFSDPPEGISKQVWEKEAEKFKLHWLFFVLNALTFVIAILLGLGFGRGESFLLTILYILLFHILGTFAALVIAINIVVIGSLSGLLIDLIVIEPVAWVIDRPTLDKWIKIGSVLMLFVGFHFDLLAS